MPELKDGESIDIQGSASKPYQVKNVAGVYSCSCPAWRNQSLPIDHRSCKHIRSYRGDDAEQRRIGNPLPASAGTASLLKVPSLLLAEPWDGQSNPAGYYLSEKLDGVRCYWDGRLFCSRNGHRFHAPEWFTEGLPLEPLDGELWIGRKQFQRTVSIVRRQDGGELWREVKFHVFDAPADGGPFESRLRLVFLIMKLCQPQYAVAHPHVVCKSRDHLHNELARVVSLGGEGLMLRQPGSPYVFGRSPTLLKVKQFQDAEARVIGHEPGAGRHKGRLGALLVEMANGTRFAVGTGLSDAERKDPPAIGSTITFRYQELTDGGVPRFPSFVRVRRDLDPSPHQQERKTQSMTPSTKRRFEYVEGTSSKFWEVHVNGNSVSVQYGRIGTTGQSDTKQFSDPVAASKHAEGKIREKVKKGYVETA